MLPAAFFRIHSDLAQEGPGSDEATREALGRLRPLPSNPRVIDMGCGPGRQTVVLARELNTPIEAIDFHEPFLEQLRATAKEQGIDHLIKTRCESFDRLTYPPGSFDLIWAEGSIFILGFAEGLGVWRPILSDNGLIAVTEATWVVDDPAEEAKAFWLEEYPSITDVQGNIEIAEKQGFEVFDHFVLPRWAWWDNYALPIAQRVDSFREEAETDEELAEAIRYEERELDICRRYGDQFAYVFYLMQKSC